MYNNIVSVRHKSTKSVQPRLGNVIASCDYRYTIRLVELWEDEEVRLWNDETDYLEKT